MAEGAAWLCVLLCVHLLPRLRPCQVVYKVYKTTRQKSVIKDLLNNQKQIRIRISKQKLSNQCVVNIKWLLTSSLNDLIYFHLWRSCGGMNLSDQQGGRSTDALGSLMWGAFITEGGAWQATLSLPESVTETHKGRQLMPLFSPASARFADKIMLTAERQDVVVELPMTHAAEIWWRDMHHIESWCESNFMTKTALKKMSLVGPDWFFLFL